MVLNFIASCCTNLPLSLHPLHHPAFYHPPPPPPPQPFCSVPSFRASLHLNFIFHPVPFPMSALRVTRDPPPLPLPHSRSHSRVPVLCSWSVTFQWRDNLFPVEITLSGIAGNPRQQVCAKIQSNLTVSIIHNENCTFALPYFILSTLLLSSFFSSSSSSSTSTPPVPPPQNENPSLFSPVLTIVTSVPTPPPHPIIITVVI